MKSDRSCVPGERVVVVIEAIPTGVQRCVRTIQCGRRSKFLGILVFGNTETSLSGEHRCHVKFPVPCAVTRVELLCDRSKPSIQAGLPAKAALFRGDSWIHKPLR